MNNIDKQYRIKAKTSRDGTKLYYPQERFFYIFWVNFLQDGTPLLESAKKSIEVAKKKKFEEYQKKIVKSEIIRL